MLISDLQSQLEQIKEEHGDLPVVCDYGHLFTAVGYSTRFDGKEFITLSTEDYSELQKYRLEV